MTHRPRLITRFTSADDAEEVFFPTALYEWESTQALRTATVAAVGADYAVDLLGRLPAPQEVARERIRALAVGDDGGDLDGILDRLRTITYRAGLGKLWSEDAGGDARWAWARLASMPDVTISYEGRRHAPVICEFARLSPWFAAAPTVVSGTNPASLPVINDGSAPARAITITITAAGAGGWDNPKVENPLTGEWFELTDQAAAGEILRVDTGRMAVERSTDGGVTWVSAYGDFATGPVQVGFLRLEPGPQTLAIAGVGDGEVEVRFYAAWI